MHYESLKYDLGLYFCYIVLCPLFFFNISRVIAVTTRKQYIKAKAACIRTCNIKRYASKKPANQIFKLETDIQIPKVLATPNVDLSRSEIMLSPTGIHPEKFEILKNMENSEREYAEPIYPNGYHNVGAERFKE